ncbi:hypothetical protein F0562_027463 [Nyssa sinensis]|uniref:Uncharacterized protein n=1 Tax=Nyssa sinensis TaxID=561372 RepID=A0A5J5B890_9ASTE|nr:hypothetical protein F0562_027463 [Nyssa sinensis]
MYDGDGFVLWQMVVLAAHSVRQCEGGDAVVLLYQSHNRHNHAANLFTGAIESQNSLNSEAVLGIIIESGKLATKRHTSLFQNFISSG